MPAIGRRLLSRFGADRRGNVAMIVGIAAIPTFAFLGFASDYAVALSDKTKLDAAADAASMTAITTAKNVIQTSQSTGSAVTAAAIAAGKTAAAAAFRANAGSIGFAATPTPNIDLTRVNQTLTATITYSALVATNFSGMIGLQSINARGTSVSTLSMPTYINYYIVVDSSQSMGIASTASDMQTLYNRVVQYSNGSDGEVGCVFGCHVLAPSQKQYTNEQLAHSMPNVPYINLRIDAAAAAVQSVVSLAQNATQTAGQNLIQLSLFTMQADPTNNTVLQTLAALEYAPYAKTSAATVPNSTATNKLDLGNNTSSGVGDSNFGASINYFVQNILANQGDGSTAQAPLNFVLIVTDGVADVPNGCASCHAVTAFDSSICSSLKAKASVGVIYTTYNAIYSQNDSSKGLESNYANLVYNNTNGGTTTVANAIVPNLQACASTPTSQFYFEATDGPAITTGMNKFFQSTSSTARLTQ